MPAVSYLYRLGCAAAGGISVHKSTIPGDHFNAGMSLEPRCERVGFAVREELNGCAPLEVDDQRAVALALAVGLVVYANDARAFFRCWNGTLSDTA